MEISAEVHFAQTLASNEKKFRDRALKRLRKYLNIRSLHGEGLSHDDFIKIWKGLHYCMWMQDKPVIQEELSQKMAELLHAFPKLQDVLRFVHVFFITEAREWGGIDRLRLDKFMMLIRGMLHEAFVLLSREEWPEPACLTFAQNLTASVTNESDGRIPYGLKIHVADIFVTEMRKVSLQGMTSRKLTILMFPFIYFLLKTKRREIAQSMYEKTIDPVLSHFGDWLWLREKRLKKRKAQKRSQKRKQMQESDEEEEGSDGEDAGDESEEEDDDDESAEMESGDDEEYEAMLESDEEEEDDDEDDDMDVDEEEVEKSKKFDLSMMIRLMKRLASGDPSVESRNRSYVYGIVESYSRRDPSILEKPEKADEDDDNEEEDDVDVANVFQLSGLVEEKRKKKKRRRRNKREEENEDDGETDSVGDINGEMGEADATSIDQTDLSSGLEDGKKMKKSKVKGHDEVEDSKTEAKGKKRKRLSSDGEETPVVANKGAKKRRIQEEEKSVSPSVNLVQSGKNNKGKKVDDDENNVAQSPVAGGGKKKNKLVSDTPSKGGGDDVDLVLNSNGNALSPSGKTKKTGVQNITLSSPMQYVVYPQKSPDSKPASMSQVAKSMSGPNYTKSTKKQNSVDMSPAKQDVVVGVGDDDDDDGGHKDVEGEDEELSEDLKKKSKSKKVQKTSPLSKQRSPEKKSPSAKCEVVKGGGTPAKGVLDAVYGTMATPCALIKKAVGLVAPSSDPGTSKKDRSGVSSEQCLTPGSQKKVVFDLRKNKANKFKDYLKTLANDPLPAYEPTRSPSQSILKSPSVESFVSLDSASSSNTPVTKRKKKGVIGGSGGRKSPGKTWTKAMKKRRSLH